MIDQSFLTYASGIAVSGLVAGGSIGYVLRGARARRQVETLTDEVNQLRTRLNGNAEKILTPQRWTGTEVAAVLGAIGTLLGVIGAFYNNYQGRTMKDLQVNLTQAEAKRQDLASKTLALLGSDIEDWSRLTEISSPPQVKNRTLDLNIDFKKIKANCSNPKQLKLTFDGLGPSILQCGSGSAVVALSKPATLLLVPNDKSK